MVRRLWLVSCVVAGCTSEPGGGDGANPIGFQVSQGPFEAEFGAERTPLWTIDNQTEETCWAMMPDGDLLLSTATRPQGLRRVGIDGTQRWSTTPLVDGMSLGFDSCGADSVRLATGADGSSYLFGAFAEQFGNASSRNGVVRLTPDGAIAYLIELPAGMQAHQGIGLPDGSMIVVTGIEASAPEDVGTQHFIRLDPSGAQVSETLLPRVHVADYVSGTDFTPGVSSGDGLPSITSLSLTRDGGLLVGGSYTFGHFIPCGGNNVCTELAADLMLARFDAAGALEWTRRYGKGYASTGQRPASLIELDDGSLLMTGAVTTTPPDPVESYAAMTVFFSSNGALSKARAYTMGPFPGANFFQRVTSFDNAIAMSDGTVDLTFAPPRTDGDGSCSIIRMNRSGELIGLQKLDPLEGLHNNRCLVAPNADRYAIRADTHWFGFSR